MTSSCDPDIFTATGVPPEGTLASTQGPSPAVFEPSCSLNTAVTWSTRPFVFWSSMASDVMTGAAPSCGANAKNDAWLPAASAIPPGMAARAILKFPTDVSAGPVPSFSVRMALLPVTETEFSEPPDGTPVRVHGAFPAV